MEHRASTLKQLNHRGNLQERRSVIYNDVPPLKNSALLVLLSRLIHLNINGFNANVSQG